MLTTTEYFLAGWGFFFILAGLTFLNFPTWGNALISISRKKEFRWIISIATILLGAVHIYFHNIWEPSVAALISCFGWIALLKGILILVNPGTLDIAQSIAKSRLFTTYLILMILMGLYFVGRAYHLILF